MTSFSEKTVRGVSLLFLVIFSFLTYKNYYYVTASLLLPVCNPESGFRRIFGGGSHFVFSEGWLPPVSSGQRIYPPARTIYPPSTGCHLGSHSLTTSWLSTKLANLSNVAAPDRTSWKGHMRRACFRVA